MMKNWKLFLAFAFLFVMSKLHAQEWKIGQDYNITFASKDASGVFKEFSGTIVFDAENLSNSSMKLKIKVESINTGNGLQNKHAKSEEWFDASKYPNISFESSRIEKTESGFKAVGKLEIRGVKKDVTIPFTFVKKGSKGTFIAKFSVDRTDYGVGKKGNDVSETIKITATIPVTK
jgi:polyisoprenoid-binding protein YceI